MRFEEALAELDSRQPERMIPNLSRITTVAQMLGDPQLAYPTIHVTGTNGKTTTARLIAALGCADGLPTGCYTSPHLDSVTERMSLCEDPIGEEEFAEAYEHLLPYLRMVDESEERVTYFEALTALAYLWFSDKPVSLAVFEVGMGGRWDATNLVAGDVAVVCPISLDHPELGSTVAEIAHEKAGIIKEGKTVVCREQPPEALSVIENRCAEVGARLLLEDRDFGVPEMRRAVGGQMVSIRGPHGSFEDVMVPLFGEHAGRHAGAAVAAVEALTDRELPEEAVREALGSATSPGRLEIVDRHPLTVLDGAHNPAGVHAIAAALLESFAWDEALVVVGVSRDKDVPGIVEGLAALEPRVFATAYEGARAAAPESVAAACRAAGLAAEPFASIREALAAARQEAGEHTLIVVTGSLYTVADARRALGS